MAWLDDRFWCHPKVNGLSDRAFRAYVNGLTYSAGMQTRGSLDVATQKLLGASPKVASELVDVGLWDDCGNGVVRIHDWDEHNGKRDERRSQERERKRKLRSGITESQWTSARARLFERDQGICVDCGTYDGGWHADHVPDRETLRKMGVDLCDIDHIETRCPSCHGRRTGLTRGKGGREGGREGGRPQRADVLKEVKEVKEVNLDKEIQPEDRAAIADAARRSLGLTHGEAA